MITTTEPTTDAAVQRVVDLGIGYAALSLADTVQTVGGVVKPKPQGVRRDQSIQLQTVAEVLDRLRWHGPWGTTNHGIKMELVRRAKALHDNR